MHFSWEMKCHGRRKKKKQRSNIIWMKEEKDKITGDYISSIRKVKRKYEKWGEKIESTIIPIGNVVMYPIKRWYIELLLTM